MGILILYMFSWISAVCVIYYIVLYFVIFNYTSNEMCMLQSYLYMYVL